VGRPASKLLIFVRHVHHARHVRGARRPAVPTIADLKGKPVVWGARGSGLVVLARYVLDGIGLDMERDFQSTYLDRAGDGPAMVMDGRAAALWGGGTGWPGFAAVGRGPQGARFIAPGTEERARIQAKHPFLKTMTIPAGAYPARERPSSPSARGASCSRDPICPTRRCTDSPRRSMAASPKLAARLPQGHETTAANTVAAAPRPELIHPGARRYFREIGLTP
jgi:TRAP-type uncharacterized transport system substrate-binding protein